MRANRLNGVGILSILMVGFIGMETSEVPKFQYWATTGEVILEDFESYSVGGVPSKWETDKNWKTLIPITPLLMRESRSFFIHEETGNKFVRASTVDDTFGMVLSNGKQFKWNLPDHPRISWDWRAVQLPEGAREDKSKKNDTGGAVYVVFSVDLIGRPRSLKYTYSSTLPVGTTTEYGALNVLVVGSGLDNIGEWQHVERDLYADYTRLFGKTPPNGPLAIVLWGDSDTMDDRSVVDFDNVTLHGQIGTERSRGHKTTRETDGNSFLGNE
jgi:hypothetical protein